MGNGKYPLSVVILAKNEEARLGPCLESVSWVDDVLVMDDESTDGTPRIARDHGARVMRRRMDIEGRHRNVGIQAGRHPWVLSLDADERVSPELAEEIRRTVGDAPRCNGYTIPIRTFMGQRWLKDAGWYPAPKLRLFLKEKFKYEEAGVHPRAFMPDPCGHLTRDIVHHSFADYADFIRKLNNQTTLEAQKWVSDGRKMSIARALRKSVDRFFRSYVLRKGYKGGFEGFMLAAFNGLYQLFTYAKYWEIKRNVIARS